MLAFLTAVWMQDIHVLPECWRVGEENYTNKKRYNKPFHFIMCKLFSNCLLPTETSFSLFRQFIFFFPIWKLFEFLWLEGNTSWFFPLKRMGVFARSGGVLWRELKAFERWSVWLIAQSLSLLYYMVNSSRVRLLHPLQGGAQEVM